MGSFNAGLALTLVLVPGALSLLYLKEWRISRKERSALAAEVSALVAAAEKRAALADGRIDANLRALREGHERLAARLQAGGNAPGTQESERGASSGSEDLDGATPVNDGASEEEIARLPPLPPGTNAACVIREQSLVDIFHNPTFNPSGKRLSRLEAARARVELARARARQEVLDAEVSLRFAEGMDQLTVEGAYVDYGPGERFETVKGVLTGGQELPDGGTRMFHYYPEEFPEIYDKRQETRRVAELSLRRVLSMFQEP
jgi:hypothetical protein